MLREVEEGIPKGKSNLEQPHIRLVDFKTTHDIYCFQKETVYKKEGLKEFLLCWDCEQRLTAGEDYVRGVLYGRKPIKEHTRATRFMVRYRQRSGRVFREGVEIRWVEFARFKQFQLGVIWKACVASGNAFKEATASVGTVESMRKSILSGNYDEQLVPCVMERFHDPNGASIEIIGPPKSLSWRSGKIINIIMGGYIWRYFVEGNVHREIALQQNGKLVIKILDVDVFYTPSEWLSTTSSSPSIIPATR